MLMKLVGEVMAIGRNFAESLQKAPRGLETGLSGLDRVRDLEGADPAEIERRLARSTPDRPPVWRPRRCGRASRSSGSTRSLAFRSVVPGSDRGDRAR